MTEHPDDAALLRAAGGQGFACDEDGHRVLPCGCYADSPMGHTCASGGSWDTWRSAP